MTIKDTGENFTTDVQQQTPTNLRGEGDNIRTSQTRLASQRFLAEVITLDKRAYRPLLVSASGGVGFLHGDLDFTADQNVEGFSSCSLPDDVVALLEVGVLERVRHLHELAFGKRAEERYFAKGLCGWMIVKTA